MKSLPLQLLLRGLWLFATWFLGAIRSFVKVHRMVACPALTFPPAQAIAERPYSRARAWRSIRQRVAAPLLAFLALCVVLVPPAFADTTTYTFAQATAAVAISGEFSAPLNAYGHDAIAVTGLTTEMRIAFNGTGIAIGGFYGDVATMQTSDPTVHASLDGGTFGPSVVTVNPTGWTDSTYSVSGLPDGPHTLTLRWIVKHSFHFLETGATAGDVFATVTGSAPSLGSVAGYGKLYTLSATGVKPFVQNENGLVVTNTADYGYTAIANMQWADESIRFRATTTEIYLWCFGNGSKLSLYVDDAVSPSAAITLPNTSAFGWVQIATGLSGTHTYEVMTCKRVPNTALWNQLRLVGGTGLDTSALLSLRPVLAGWGDSITEAGSYIASNPSQGSEVGYLRKLGRAKGYCIANRGIPSSTLKVGGSVPPGLSRLGDINTLAHAPAIILDLYGSNDMAGLANTQGDTETPADFVGYCTTAYNSFLSQWPNVKIYALEILPRQGSVTPGWEAVKEQTRIAVGSSRVTRFNSAPWVPATSANYPDSVHPSGTGYDLLASPLLPQIPSARPVFRRVANPERRGARSIQ